MGGYMHTDDPVSGSEQHDHIDIIAIKSNAATSVNWSPYWNEFVGFSITPAWTPSDTTPYSSNVTIDAPYTFGAYVANPSGSSTTHTINFNSDAITDINTVTNFQFMLLEYDRYYLDDVTAVSYTHLTLPTTPYV